MTEATGPIPCVCGAHMDQVVNGIVRACYPAQFSTSYACKSCKRRIFGPWIVMTLTGEDIPLGKGEKL
jgi:hypothetical protein